jgi:hypothetical protein
VTARDVDIAHWTALVLTATGERPALLPHLAVVAVRAGHLARTAGLGDRDAALLEVAGLVHDVAKVPSFAQTGFHPLDAARLAEREGAPTLAVLVAQHTGARYEAQLHGIELSYPWEPSPLHDLLMLADLTTGPDGIVTTLASRRADIEHRYAPDSVEVRSLHRLWPEVLAAAQRYGVE